MKIENIENGVENKEDDTLIGMIYNKRYSEIKDGLEKVVAKKIVDLISKEKQILIDKGL